MKEQDFQFPSEGFAQRARIAKQKLDEFNEAAETLRKKEQALRRNRDFLQNIEMRDVDGEISACVTEIRESESKAAGAKVDLAKLFLDEKRRYDELSGNVLGRLNAGFIQPFMAEIRDAKSSIDSLSEKILKLNTALPDGADSFEQIEAAVSAFNSLAIETGAPGNAHVTYTESVRA